MIDQLLCLFEHIITSSIITPKIIRSSCSLRILHHLWPPQNLGLLAFILVVRNLLGFVHPHQPAIQQFIILVYVASFLLAGVAQIEPRLEHCPNRRESSMPIQVVPQVK